MEILLVVVVMVGLMWWGRASWIFEQVSAVEVEINYRVSVVEQWLKRNLERNECLPVDLSEFCKSSFTLARQKGCEDWIVKMDYRRFSCERYYLGSGR